MEINLVLNNVRVGEIKSKVVDIVDQIEKGSLLKVSNVTVNVVEDTRNLPKFVVRGNITPDVLQNVVVIDKDMGDVKLKSLDENTISIYTLLESVEEDNNKFTPLANDIRAYFSLGITTISALRNYNGRYGYLENVHNFLEIWDQKKNLPPNIQDCENDSFSSLQIPPNVIITDLLRCSERDSVSEDSKFITSLMSAGIDTVKQAHELVLKKRSKNVTYVYTDVFLTDNIVDHLEKLIIAWAKRFL